MTKTKPKIAIVNVVATATINQRLDLVDITKKFPGVEYHPEQFSEIIQPCVETVSLIGIDTSRVP